MQSDVFRRGGSELRIARVNATIRFAILLSGLLASGPVLACSSPTASAAATPSPIPPAIHTIKHVIVIMQENRSFDSYFGTYPGADGIPMTRGGPSVCVPDPQTTQCVKPYADHADGNARIGGR
jgi:phospholipase C